MSDAGWAVIIFGEMIFILALGLSFHKTGFDLSKLDHGEIRKSIAIAFTVIYIILLPYYFFNVYIPAVKNITNLNATVQNSQMQTFNITAAAVPAMAITDLLKNFLYVYIAIIVFYFVSRGIDNYADAKRTEALSTQDASKIADMRYARGKITADELKKTKEGLKQQ